MQPPEGATSLNCFELLPVGDPAANIENDLAQRDAHGHFHQTRVHYAAGQGKDLGALALLRPNGGKPLATVADNRRNVREGLDVIDQRRATP